MLSEKVRKVLTVLFWVLAVICMAVIFWLSSRTAYESAEQSTVIADFLRKIFGDGIITDFIVRKSAHCLEFTGLSLLLNIALCLVKDRPAYFSATALTSIYAVTDEIHQIFVEGRSCQVSDWAIDTGGAILGTIGFFVILHIIQSICSKNNTQ